MLVYIRPGKCSMTPVCMRVDCAVLITSGLAPCTESCLSLMATLKVFSNQEDQYLVSAAWPHMPAARLGATDRFWALSQKLVTFCS